MIFSSTALGFLSRTTEGVVFGRSFFAAAAMLSLVALPLIVASDPRGAERDPPPRARGLLRGRQDEGGDDAADPAADLPVRRSRPARCSASAGSSATPRSSSSCSAPPRTSPRSKARLPAQLPARRRHDADQLRLRGVADREPQPAPESLCGGFRPAADGAGPERGRRRRPPPRPKGRNVEFIASVPEFDRQVGGVSAEVPRRRRSGGFRWRTPRRLAGGAARERRGQRRRRLRASGFTAAKRSIARAAVLDPAHGDRQRLGLLRDPGSGQRRSRCRSARARCCR